jgi:MerR family redox-sensitive transcriptional activator SoxR
MKKREGLVVIGELARRTGVAGSALRYYERVGLLSPEARLGGRRYYGASVAERVAVVQLCQEAGFTLREIRALLAGWRGRGRAWTHLARAKVKELETRIAQAERAKALVQHALACPHASLVTCPNFRAAVAVHLDDGKHDRPRRRPKRAAAPRG